jgi:phosphopantothenate-cysteine ligase
MRPVLQQYRQVQKEHQLLMIPFVTVHDYLYLLRDISKLMNDKLGSKAILYLAAAVSDFYVPQEEMVRMDIKD